jgi:hypothetical protein
MLMSSHRSPGTGERSCRRSLSTPMILQGHLGLAAATERLAGAKVQRSSAEA